MILLLGPTIAYSDELPKRRNWMLNQAEVLPIVCFGMAVRPGSELKELKFREVTA